MTQTMDALAQANEIRLHRSGVKQRIRRGEISVADALADPIVTREGVNGKGMTIGELLRAQNRWGHHRVRQFMSENLPGVAQHRPLHRLSPRQRELVAEVLSDVR
jgi:hypothetical protein